MSNRSFRPVAFAAGLVIGIMLLLALLLVNPFLLALTALLAAAAMVVLFLYQRNTRVRSTLRSRLTASILCFVAAALFVIAAVVQFESQTGMSVVLLILGAVEAAAGLQSLVRKEKPS